MNNKVAIYGFTQEQLSLLLSYMPDGYIFKKVDDTSELIGTHGICSIIYSEGMDARSRELLDNFYLDVGENTDEQVIWIDSQTNPPTLEEIYFHYNNLLELLPELDKVLTRAQKHYAIRQMYCGAYAFLPKRGIEEMIEEEIYAAFCFEYGKKPDKAIRKRMRQELTALQEVDALPELAAAFELSHWLISKRIPFFVEHTTASGLIPYLLGITQTNPAPPHTLCPKCSELHWHKDYKDGFDIPAASCPDCGTPLTRDGHDLVWQEYAGYGRVPTYGFWLPDSMQEQICEWVENHWLKKVREDVWGPVQQTDHRIDAGVFYFLFVLDGDTLPRDFHQRKVTAEQREELVRLVGEKWEKHAGPELPYPKTAAEALAVYELIGDGHTGNGDIKCFLDSGLTVSDLICCREDVFHYLCDHGFIEKDAFRGMTHVRKGKGFPVITDEMQNARDKWVLRQCAEVSWLPSKASDLERLLFQIRGGFVDISK